MKIDRRCFLSLGMGLSAGAVLTPLPWKLADDSSIWSQNWEWTPVPKDDVASYEKTACSLCPGGCGLLVRKVGNRAVKVEGMPRHPVNNGGVCTLGLSSLQLLYGPTRIKTPLKRIGNRGDGKWEKISWRAAIEAVAKKLGDHRKKGESHMVAAIMGSDRGTVPQLMARLLTAYGSPNFFRMPSAQDAYESTLYLMHGVQAMAGFDVDNTDYVLSFGSGLIEGWGAPVHMLQANSRWKATGTKVVQVEPRLSNTAAKSDEWVAIIPGTEAALALGLAHVILKENKQCDFVSNAAFGFDDWVDENGQQKKGFKQIVMASYSPEKVATITGIAAEKIVRLAKEFAGAKRPLAVAGRGSGNTPVGFQEMMAVHALNALVGSINRPGGIWTVPEPDYVKWPAPEMDQIAAKGIQQGRLDGAGSSNAPYARFLLNRLSQADTKNKYSLKALLVSGANPLYSLPDTKAVQKAFDGIPFIASFSSYFDETTQYADIILPNHVFLERLEDVPAPRGFHKPMIGLSQPVVSSKYDTRHIGDALIAIARKIGGTVSSAFPWNNYETCLRTTLADKWPMMVKNGFWWNQSYLPSNNGAGFHTPSGKFEFSETVFSTYQPVALEGDESAYPLVLVPYDHMRLSSGYVGSPPFMMKTVSDKIVKGNDGFVEINPETAKKLKLADGQSAVLTTPKGSVNVRVNVFDGIRPGLLAMSRGLGHTAYDDYLAGKGVNVHSLMGPVEDPLSGLDAAWGIRAKLTKA